MEESKVLQCCETAAQKPATAVVLGRDSAGRDVICDLAKMPHLIVAGVRLSAVSGLLRKMTDDLRAQGVSVAVPQPDEAFDTLESAKAEMKSRLALLEAAKARSIEAYMPEPGGEQMDRRIVVVWELAALMQSDAERTESLIASIAQTGRRAGIHLIVATRRPHADVLSGIIRANIPSRIALCVRTQVQSRLILDRKGAERLGCENELLYLPIGTGEENSAAVCCDGIGSDSEEALLCNAVTMAINEGEITLSLVQRRLLIGFLRTGRILEELVLCGLIRKVSAMPACYAPCISCDQWLDWQDIAPQARI